MRLIIVLFILVSLLTYFLSFSFVSHNSSIEEVIHFSPMNSKQSYLMSKNGNILHKWSLDEKGGWYITKIFKDKLYAIHAYQAIDVVDCDSNRIWSKVGRYHHDFVIYKGYLYALKSVPEIVNYDGMKLIVLNDLIVRINLKDSKKEDLVFSALDNFRSNISLHRWRQVKKYINASIHDRSLESLLELGPQELRKYFVSDTPFDLFHANSLNIGHDREKGDFLILNLPYINKIVFVSLTDYSLLNSLDVELEGGYHDVQYNNRIYLFYNNRHNPQTGSKILFFDQNFSHYKDLLNSNNLYFHTPYRGRFQFYNETVMVTSAAQGLGMQFELDGNLLWKYEHNSPVSKFVITQKKDLVCI